MSEKDFIEYLDDQVELYRLKTRVYKDEENNQAKRDKLIKQQGVFEFAKQLLTNYQPDENISNDKKKQ